jgi:hypothetical protein
MNRRKNHLGKKLAVEANHRASGGCGGLLLIEMVYENKVRGRYGNLYSRFTQFSE